ncbi:cupin [Streptomyces sp. NPDC059698]|uniref:cupin n=1 Tax=unclassified Streptomyces TaxID=2593676 RepID=UPI0009395E21|nr:cupin [Streptomyces sp. CB02366]OKJ32627.1 cupin [Streptomyces sp. CB02366]TVP37677.1 cupin [Streptomyces griseus subsp. griseus]WSS54114.1 cupin [Streptomyces sp. NBC_01178]
MDDLNALAEEHLAAARASAHGRSAHLLLQQPPLRQTVIALTEGTALDEHNAPPAASLLVLRGSVRVTAASGDADLPAGVLYPVPRERHGMLALRDAVVLLTAVND